MSTKYNSSSFQNPSTCSDDRGSKEQCNPFLLSKSRSEYSPSYVDTSGESLYFAPNNSQAASAASTRRSFCEDERAKMMMGFSDGGWSHDLRSGIPPSNLMPFSADKRCTEDMRQSNDVPSFDNAQPDRSRSQYLLSALDQGKIREYNMGLPSKCHSLGWNQRKTNEPNQATRSAGSRLMEEQKQPNSFVMEKVEYIHGKAKGGDGAKSPSIHSDSNVNPKTIANRYLPGFLTGKKTLWKDRKHDTSKDSGDSSPRAGLFSEYAIPYTHGLSSTLMSLT